MAAPMGQIKTRGGQNASREPLPEPPAPEWLDAPPADQRLAVVTWLWRDPSCRTTYTADHVNAWARMVRRNLTLPARVVCLTDDPDGIDDCETAPIPDDLANITTKAWPRQRGYPQCYRRIALWRPNIADVVGADRILSMDLDVCIRASIDPLLLRAEPVVLAAGTGPRRQYNGSLLLLTAGARPDVYDDFDADAAELASRRYLGSDQAWLAYKLGDEKPRFGDDDGVRHYDMRLANHLRRNRRLGDDPRVIFFTGHAKPWQFKHPDIAGHYG